MYVYAWISSVPCKNQIAWKYKTLHIEASSSNAFVVFIIPDQTSMNLSLTLLKRFIADVSLSIQGDTKPCNCRLNSYTVSCWLF